MEDLSSVGQNQGYGICGGKERVDTLQPRSEALVRPSQPNPPSGQRLRRSQTNTLWPVPWSLARLEAKLEGPPGGRRTETKNPGLCTIPHSCEDVGSSIGQ